MQDSAKVMVHIDPNSNFKGVENTALFEATGLIPMFVVETVVYGPEPTGAKEFMACMDKAYGFQIGDYDMLADGKGKVDGDGVYSYPEDPDLHPLVLMETQKGMRVYIYQYGLVAVRDLDNKTVMKRMD